VALGALPDESRPHELIDLTPLNHEDHLPGFQLKIPSSGATTRALTALIALLVWDPTPLDDARQLDHYNNYNIYLLMNYCTVFPRIWSQSYIFLQKVV
jgi:hypothetical protein